MTHIVLCFGNTVILTAWAALTQSVFIEFAQNDRQRVRCLQFVVGHKLVIHHISGFLALNAVATDISLILVKTNRMFNTFSSLYQFRFTNSFKKIFYKIIIRSSDSESGQTVPVRFKCRPL